jgi:hypothetical protein
MQRFRHYGQDLIEFTKLLVRESLKKKIIYIITCISNYHFIVNVLPNY